MLVSGRWKRCLQRYEYPRQKLEARQGCETVPWYASYHAIHFIPTTVYDLAGFFANTIWAIDSNTELPSSSTVHPGFWASIFLNVARTSSQRSLSSSFQHASCCTGMQCSQANAASAGRTLESHPTAYVPSMPDQVHSGFVGGAQYLLGRQYVSSQVSPLEFNSTLHKHHSVPDVSR